MSKQAMILAPEVPLYQWGALGQAPARVRIRRRPHTIGNVGVPLYQRGTLGQAPGKIIGASAPVAATVTTSLVAGAGGGAAEGAAMASWAGPIGAAVGVVVGLVGGLLAAHEMRAKQARNENQAVNLAYSTWDSDLKQIYQAFKAGQISSSDAISAIEQTLMPGYWTIVSPQIQPGRNGCQNGTLCPPDTAPSPSPGFTPASPGPQPCAGSIGAACCLGCYPLLESLSNPNGIIAAINGQSISPKGPYSAEILAIGASKYGTSYRAPYSLDWTPPAPPAASVSSFFSPTTAGAAGGVSTSALAPLILAGLALMFFMGGGS